MIRDIPTQREQLEERFWDKVSVEGENECWNWLAGRFTNGYGKFYLNSKYVNAHRASWELLNGAIPEGLLVLHKCDNRLCVNPGHLFLGTHSDNSYDKVIKGRHRNGRGIATFRIGEAWLIRKLGKAGISQRVIGKMFGVSQSTISRALCWPVILKEGGVY